MYLWRKQIASTIVLLCLIMPIFFSASVISSYIRIDKLQAGSVDLLTRANELQNTKEVDHPFEWIEIANLLVERSQDSDSLSIDLLEKALEAERYHPHAWTLLSYLHTRQSRVFTSEAQDALAQSIAVCPYCDASLLRWRLTFGLRHWADLDQPTKLAIFEGADLLRWWHLDIEYLDQVRTDAIALGIPFDDLRRNVDTPVRPHEIGREPQSG